MHKTSLPQYRSQMKLDSPSWLNKGKLHHGIREFPACNQLPKAWYVACITLLPFRGKAHQPNPNFLWKSQGFKHFSVYGSVSKMTVSVSLSTHYTLLNFIYLQPVASLWVLACNLDPQVEIITNTMRTAQETHTTLASGGVSKNLWVVYNATQHISLPYRNMQAGNSPAFAAHRQVFHGQAPSIEPVPMPKATTGRSHQNTAHLQNSQSFFIPLYQAPLVSDLHVQSCVEFIIVQKCDIASTTRRRKK